MLAKCKSFRSVSLERTSLAIALLLAYRSDTGYKNDVSGKEAEEGTVFDELFDPEGLRLAYITIAAHMRGYRCTRIRVHTSIWILDPSALKCVHVQELPTHHVRAKECRRLCRPDISRSIGRSVERFASANSPCKIMMEQIRARSSRLPKCSSRRAGITSDR